MTETLTLAKLSAIIHEMKADKMQAVRVIETVNATTPYEDWSKVRSPSRTRRRLKRGFPNRNIVTRQKPAAYRLNGVLYVHPEIARAVHQVMAHRIDESIRRAMLGMPLL